MAHVSVVTCVTACICAGDGIIRTAVDLRTVTTDTITCTVSVTDGKNTVNNFVVTVKLTSEFLVTAAGIVIVPVTSAGIVIVPVTNAASSLLRAMLYNVH